MDEPRGPDRRLRLCGQGFHAVPVPMGGGTAHCPQCGAAVTVAPRVLAPLGGPPGAAEEPQRIAMLARQAEHYNAAN